MPTLHKVIVFAENCQKSSNKTVFSQFSADLVKFTWRCKSTACFGLFWQLTF